MADSTLEDKLKAALDKAITLDIITVVGRYENGAPVDNAPMMRTRLNLIDGNKITEIPKEFLAGEQYAAVRDYHAQAEAAGHQIIATNLEALEKLVKLIASLKK